MKLDHGTISRDAAADALHLLLQNVEVGRRDALVLLNDDVASAKEAETFTEGNVHVKRNGRPGTLGFFVDALEIGGAERIVPHQRGRVAEPKSTHLKSSHRHHSSAVLSLHK